MTDITDVVKALSELSTKLRTLADHESGEYARQAFHFAANEVSAVMVGPAMQAALDEMDARS